MKSSLVCLLISGLWLNSDCYSQSNLKINIDTILQGDQQWDWTQVRTGMIRNDPPVWITTMSQTAKEGAHGYHDVFYSISRDQGASWSHPKAIESLRRRAQADGYEVVAGDLWPSWHAKSGKVLITGKTFNFEDGTKENIHREKVAYALYDPDLDTFSPLRTLEMPENDHAGLPIIAPNAGCHQPVILANGDVLLPIRYQRSVAKRNYTSIVARCRFDGASLHYVQHGTEHSIATRRGLYEPSVFQFQDRFYLTMRADDGAFVASSADGIHYSDPIEWTFDDGQPLGSYNTQQHWASIDNHLYLIYTRRGANNDHIMRHRAPLFIAEVDPDKLKVVRSTEQILVPENDATLGNSGVCQVGPSEAWVTVAEGRVSLGPRKGQANKVFLARVAAPAQ